MRKLGQSGQTHSTFYHIHRNLIWFCIGLVFTLFINFFVLPIYQSATCSDELKFNRSLIVIFGDSLSQRASNGWIGLLSNWYSRKADLINRGYSGYNTRWGLSIFDKVVAPLKPNFLIIFFGANDAVFENIPQYVPLSEYKLNLIQMIEKSKKNIPDVQILLITPPPIFEQDLQKWNKLKNKTIIIDRSNERTLSYVKICDQVGLTYNIPVVNALVGLGGETNNMMEYLEDGLHLNQKGNEKLYQLITNEISIRLPSWIPDNMPNDQPTWQAMTTKQFQLKS